MDKISSAKSKIRLVKLIARNNIHKAIREKKEELILQQVFNEEMITNSQNIAIYYSIKKEVSTIKIIERLLQEKHNVFLPRINSKGLEFHQIKDLKNDLELHNRYLIYEPHSMLERISKVDLDVIIVPIVAFDDDNNRLGYGKGYYDRFLFDFPHTMIGLAFHEQKITKLLPINEYDIKMHKIIYA